MSITADNLNSIIKSVDTSSVMKKEKKNQNEGKKQQKQQKQQRNNNGNNKKVANNKSKTAPRKSDNKRNPAPEDLVFSITNNAAKNTTKFDYKQNKIQKNQKKTTSNKKHKYSSDEEESSRRSNRSSSKKTSNNKRDSVVDQSQNLEQIVRKVLSETISQQPIAQNQSYHIPTMAPQPGGFWTPYPSSGSQGTTIVLQAPPQQQQTSNKRSSSKQQSRRQSSDDESGSDLDSKRPNNRSNKPRRQNDNQRANKPQRNDDKYSKYDDIRVSAGGGERVVVSRSSSNGRSKPQQKRR